jgi:hypothetical protein
MHSQREKHPEGFDFPVPGFPVPGPPNYGRGFAVLVSPADVDPVEVEPVLPDERLPPSDVLLRGEPLLPPSPRSGGRV